MGKASYLLSSIASIQSDAGDAIMKLLLEHDCGKGVNVVVKQGTFKVSVAIDKSSGRKAVKIIHNDTGKIFSHFTINPNLLIYILEAIEAMYYV